MYFPVKFTFSIRFLYVVFIKNTALEDVMLDYKSMVILTQKTHKDK